MRVKHLTTAMLKDNFRQFEIIFWTIAFPVFFLFFFIGIFGNVMAQESSPEIELKIGVFYEQELTGFTKTIFDDIFTELDKDVENDFTFFYFDSKEIGIEEMKKRNIDIMLVFPENFNELNAKMIFGTDSPSEIEILYSPRNEATLGRDIFTSIINEVNLMINTRGQEVKLNAVKNPIGEDEEKVIFRYEDFLFPSTLLMAILTVSIFNMPLTIVDFVEKGIIKRIISTPTRKSDYFFSFLISQFLVLFLGLIALFIASNYINVSDNIYSAKFVGFLFFSVVTALSYGLLFASFFKKTATLGAFTNIMYFVTMFLSGFFFEIQSLPASIRWYSNINPATYLVGGMRNIILGVNLDLNHFLIPSIWFVVGLIIFIYNQKKVMLNEQ